MGRGSERRGGRRAGGRREAGGARVGVCLEALGRAQPDLCPFQAPCKELRVFPGGRLFPRYSWERTPPRAPCTSQLSPTGIPAPKPFMLIKPLSQSAGWRVPDSRASAPFRNWVFPRILTRHAPCGAEGQSRSWLLVLPGQMPMQSLGTTAPSSATVLWRGRGQIGTSIFPMGVEFSQLQETTLPET